MQEVREEGGRGEEGRGGDGKGGKGEKYKGRKDQVMEDKKGKKEEGLIERREREREINMYLLPTAHEDDRVQDYSSIIVTDDG